MMKRFLILAIALPLVLISCSTSPTAEPIDVGAIQTQAVQTEQATVKLDEVDLDAVPFQNGDLPNQYQSGQITYKWADDLPKTVEPDNVILQKVGWSISDGYEDDYVMIALFSSQSDLDASFDAVTGKYRAKTQEPAAAGERSAFVMVSTFSGDGFLSFTRCSALVVIRTTGANVDEDLLTSYAQRIDKRLKPLACQ